MFEKPGLKVGALFIASFLLVGYMSMKVTKGMGLFTVSEQYNVTVNNATGIIPNTAVKMAGVKIGIVKDIKLKDGKAILTLAIRSGLGLSSSSYVKLEIDGILGSKHIAIYNGKSKGLPLKSGDFLNTVASADSMNDVLSEVGRVAISLNEIAQAIKEATITGTAQTPVGRIITNLEILTANLVDVSSVNGGKVNSIVDKVDGITETLESIMGRDSKERVNEAFDKALNSLGKFDESLKNVLSITDKIDRGEGTIGRLINDETTVEGINKTVENLNTLLGGVRTIRTSFDYHSEFLTKNNDVRYFLGLKLQPGTDRYYEIAAIQDKFGLNKKKRIIREGSQKDDYIEEITYDNKVKITALLAKNFYNFTFKGGLIEGEGGFGVDYTTFNKKLRLSTEFFNFSGNDKGEKVNIRFVARYDFYRGLYLIGGYNDILNGAVVGRQVLSSPFVGGGLFLTNDDLAALASFAL